MTMA